MRWRRSVSICIFNHLFKNSFINSLTVSFCNSIIDKKILFNEYKYLFDLEKPNCLKEIQLLSNSIIEKVSLKEMLSTIKTDKVERFYFEFNKLSLENFNYFKSNLQKINLKNDSDKFYEKKINYFFNLIKKYKNNIDRNINRRLLCSIIKYVSPIYLTDIEIKFRE